MEDRSWPRLKVERLDPKPLVWSHVNVLLARAAPEAAWGQAAPPRACALRVSVAHPSLAGTGSSVIIQLMRAIICLALASAFPAGMIAAANDSREAERDRMVTHQIAARGITDGPTLAAMRKVPRHQFVPDAMARSAYDDSPLPIGHGQTISQPLIVAFMTEAAKITRDAKVLEIGTGSGYQAAVAAELSDHVFSIEIVPALAERASAGLKASGYERVKTRAGDGYHGWPEHAPFDVIIVTAAADTLPPPLIAQLKEGGRMLIPVGPQFGAQNLVLVTKEGGKVRTRTLMPVRFVPFTRAKP
jgi:protein-L-isoaspartate(D-aspartate) O-methyltransferase